MKKLNPITTNRVSNNRGSLESFLRKGNILTSKEGLEMLSKSSVPALKEVAQDRCLRPELFSVLASRLLSLDCSNKMMGIREKIHAVLDHHYASERMDRLIFTSSGDFDDIGINRELEEMRRISI